MVLFMITKEQEPLNIYPADLLVTANSCTTYLTPLVIKCLQISLKTDRNPSISFLSKGI